LINDGVERRRLGAAGVHRADRLCDPVRQLQHLHTVIQRRITTASSQHPTARKIRKLWFPAVALRPGARRAGDEREAEQRN
jgi:hypothetical protein